MGKQLCLAILGAILIWNPAAATVYLINPDGTGDFPTIVAAVQSAQDGDTILLADGTFTGSGNRDVDLLGKTLTISSKNNNPLTCVIDCEGTPDEEHGAFLIQNEEGSDTVISGITMQNAYCQGGAINCGQNTAPQIIGCIFRNNGSPWNGGAIWCQASSPTIRECVFIDNETGGFGGAISFFSSDVVIENCTFQGNNSNAYGGALDFHYHGTQTVNNCTFSDNSAGQHGGAIRCSAYVITEVTNCTFTDNSAVRGGAISCVIETEPVIESCTFFGNAAEIGGALYSGDMCYPDLSRCIIAFGGGGGAVGCYSDLGHPRLRCCDVFGNDGGDWIGCISDQISPDYGNISEDPLFCGPAVRDFSLQDDSPCVADSEPNPQCDLIGAWPIGCGGTPTGKVSWGSLKTLYQ